MQTILVLLFETVWVCFFFFNIFHPQLIMDAEPLDTESWLYFLPGLRISLCLAWGPYNCETSFPYWEMWYTIKDVLEKKAPHISLPETNSSSCHPSSLPQKTDTFDMAALILYVSFNQTCFCTTSHGPVCLVHVILSWRYNKGLYRDALQFPQSFPSVRQAQGDSSLFAFSYNFVFVAFNKVTKITLIAFIVNVIDTYINAYITYLYIMHIYYSIYVCVTYALYRRRPAKLFQLFLTLCDSAVHRAPPSMRF